MITPSQKPSHAREIAHRINNSNVCGGGEKRGRFLSLLAKEPVLALLGEGLGGGSWLGGLVLLGDGLLVAWSASQLLVSVLEDVASTAAARVLSTSRRASRDGLNVLALASLAGVVVLGHVASAATTSGDNRAPEDRSLEIGGVRLGSVRSVGHVAGTTASVRGDHCDG